MLQRNYANEQQNQERRRSKRQIERQQQRRKTMGARRGKSDNEATIENMHPNERVNREQRGDIEQIPSESNSKRITRQWKPKMKRARSEKRQMIDNRNAETESAMKRRPLSEANGYKLNANVNTVNIVVDAMKTTNISENISEGRMTRSEKRKQQRIAEMREVEAQRKIRNRSEMQADVMTMEQKRENIVVTDQTKRAVAETTKASETPKKVSRMYSLSDSKKRQCNVPSEKPKDGEWCEPSNKEKDAIRSKNEKGTSLVKRQSDAKPCDHVTIFKQRDRSRTNTERKAETPSELTESKQRQAVNIEKETAKTTEKYESTKSVESSEDTKNARRGETEQRGAARREGNTAQQSQLLAIRQPQQQRTVPEVIVTVEEQKTCKMETRDDDNREEREWQTKQLRKKLAERERAVAARMHAYANRADAYSERWRKVQQDEERMDELEKREFPEIEQSRETRESVTQFPTGPFAEDTYEITYEYRGGQVRRTAVELKSGNVCQSTTQAAAIEDIPRWASASTLRNECEEEMQEREQVSDRASEITLIDLRSDDDDEALQQTINMDKDVMCSADTRELSDSEQREREIVQRDNRENISTANELQREVTETQPSVLAGETQIAACEYECVTPTEEINVTETSNVMINSIRASQENGSEDERSTELRSSILPEISMAQIERMPELEALLNLAQDVANEEAVATAEETLAGPNERERIMSSESEGEKSSELREVKNRSRKKSNKRRKSTEAKASQEEENTRAPKWTSRGRFASERKRTRKVAKAVKKASEGEQATTNAEMATRENVDEQRKVAGTSKQ
ncbi:PREDICTED: trichohyalin-like [Cyphomyrmex costatus]|uniref:trichohyalin-like n=1 Tax=Cyphomyrmex costatus TaxID=456900 RepID=UPI0008522841|nr:PREDICTED: trichohyalin-like [Cyphomyrmex costatus]